MKYEPKTVFIIEDGAYIELPYSEFCMRRDSNEAYADRFLIPVHGMLMEVSKEGYESFYREKERIRYLQKLDRDAGLLSLEAIGSEGGSGEGLLPAEAEDIAEMVAESLMLDKLRECLRLLPDDELELIHALFYEELTEREYARKKGVYHNAVHKRKARILAKLKKFLET